MCVNNGADANLYAIHYIMVVVRALSALGRGKMSRNKLSSILDRKAPAE
jgi:hypothetical protein